MITVDIILKGDDLDLNVARSYLAATGATDQTLAKPPGKLLIWAQFRPTDLTASREFINLMCSRYPLNLAKVTWEVLP